MAKNKTPTLLERMQGLHDVARGYVQLGYTVVSVDVQLLPDNKKKLKFGKTIRR